MNASNLNSTCFTVKCLFTAGERVAIILSLFLVFFLSLVGNCVLVFVIVNNRRLRTSSTNVSILNLSVSNLLITTFYIPASTIDIFIIDEWVFGLIGCKLITFLQHLSINTAIVTLVIISVEKFLVVSYPFYVRSERRKVRYLILVAWVIGMVESAVYLSFRTVKEFYGKVYCIEDWPSFKSRQVFVVLEAVVFCFVPLVFMIVLHAITIKRIQARLQYRSRQGTKDEEHTEVIMIRAGYQSSRLKKRKKAVVMLVVIVATFAFTLSPNYIFYCWRLLANPETVHDLYAINVGYIVTIMLVFLNCACHPVIYGLMSSEYRNAAKSTLSFRRPTGSRSTTPTRSSTRRHKTNALVLTPLGHANGTSS